MHDCHTPISERVSGFLPAILGKGRSTGLPVLIALGEETLGNVVGSFDFSGRSAKHFGYVGCGRRLIKRIRSRVTALMPKVEAFVI